MNEPSYVLYNVLATVPYLAQRTTLTNIATVYKLKGIVANVERMRSLPFYKLVQTLIK